MIIDPDSKTNPSASSSSSSSSSAAADTRQHPNPSASLPPAISAAAAAPSGSRTRSYTGYRVDSVSEDEPTHSPVESHASTRPLLSPRAVDGLPSYQSALASPAVAVPFYGYDWEELRVKRAVERRFFRAFAVALVVWVLFVLLGKMAADITVEIVSGTPSRVLPSHGTIVQCHKGSNTSAPWHSSSERQPSQHTSLPKYVSELNLTMPASRAGYYLLSAGALTYGVFTIQESIEIAQDSSEDMRVSVKARYYTKDAFQLLDVCELERDDGSRGLGIYTPTYMLGNFPAEHQVEIGIAYTIPITWANMEGRRVPFFNTDLPRFSHVAYDLSHIKFREFAMQSSNSAIVLVNVDAADITLESTNGVVAAEVIKTQGRVRITTTNAAVEIGSLEMMAVDRWSAPNLKISTTNGRVNVAAKLQSLLESSAFFLSVNTTNSATALVIKEAPQLSQLALESFTSNGAADVILHPTFEGSVHLQGMPTRLDIDPAVQDYLGRSLSARRAKNSPTNEREWVGELGYDDYSEKVPRHYGSLEVRTTNAPARVTVPCLLPYCMHRGMPPLD